MRSEGILVSFWEKGRVDTMSNLKTVLPPIVDLEPSEDCILWRYTDVPSLIEILTFRYIPLVKISRLSDQTEGTILKSVLDKLPKATDIGKDFLFNLYKNIIYVSCWCANEHELAPMWERFSSRNGVAIKTNAKRLLDSLTPPQGGIFKTGYVEYIDENPNDILSERTAIDSDEFDEIQYDAFFYKMSDFSDEREVRILRGGEHKNLSELASDLQPTNLYEIQQLMDTHLVPKEDIMQAGLSSKDELITEIVISPSAHSGVFKTIERLIGILNILRSQISEPAISIEVNESRRKTWF